MSKSDHSPIGVFDSGLGGLTVVKELIRQLPSEDIVYYGDTARVPYGTKSKESIVQFSEENTRILLENNVKMVVVACNSSSSYALSYLRKNFNVPIVGVIHPGVKKACTVTQNQKVGVIATSATIKSQKYTQMIKRRRKSVRVYAQSCPLFVPFVEEGWLNKKVTVDVAREYLEGLKKANIDTLILGCTHYPLLKSVLRKVMGRSVVLVDSAMEVAREVHDQLLAKELLTDKKKRPKYRFLISDKPQGFGRIAQNFLKRKIRVEHYR